MKWHQILRKRLNYSKTEEGKPLCWDPAGPQELLRVLQRLCPLPGSSRALTQRRRHALLPGTQDGETLGQAPSCPGRTGGQDD